MASAAEPGVFIVAFSNQQENNPTNVYANHTNVISGGAKAAPTGATFEAIPKAFEGLLQQQAATDGRVLVFFKSDAVDIIESEESQWEIPVLVYNTAGALVGRDVLTSENMTGFTTAGTTDVSCLAGIPARVAYKDVPRGLMYRLDPNGKVRGYMGDDTA